MYDQSKKEQNTTILITTSTTESYGLKSFLILNESLTTDKKKIVNKLNVSQRTVYVNKVTFD